MTAPTLPAAPTDRHNDHDRCDCCGAPWPYYDELRRDKENDDAERE